MNLEHDDAIDSKCTDCGENAIDYVEASDGTRRYACEGCLEQLLRFDAAESLADLPDTPRVIVCTGCSTITLASDANASGKCPSCVVGEAVGDTRQVIASPGGEDDE